MAFTQLTTGIVRVSTVLTYVNSPSLCELLAAFPFLTLDTPNGFLNLVEYFDSGRSRVPGSHPFLGKRPVVSRNPLKYADHYEWWTWDEVAHRRRLLGSALSKLFADGVIGGPLRTVGIYSANCPGACAFIYA